MSEHKKIKNKKHGKSDFKKKIQKDFIVNNNKK